MDSRGAVTLPSSRRQTGRRTLSPGVARQRRKPRPVSLVGTGLAVALACDVGEAYTITLEGNFPAQAITPEAGLYLEGKRIAPLQASNVLKASLPPCTGDRIRLELRVGGWVPQKVVPGSKDPRTLGIQLSRITMRAATAGTNIFNANKGTWLAPVETKP